MIPKRPTDIHHPQVAEVYLCVKAKADPDPSRGLEGDEICIDMANQERIDMKSESNIIVEFFFSASGSKGYPATGGYEPTGKDLKCQYNYRFQIEGYNHNQARASASRFRKFGQFPLPLPPVKDFCCPLVIQSVYSDTLLVIQLLRFWL